jgi:hypothetical protein
MIMENNNIDEMICTQIDWDMVFAFSKKDETEKTEWIEKEQLKMLRRIKFMFDLELTEFKTNTWLLKTFTLNDAIDKNRIQLAFIPMEMTFHFKDKLFQMNSYLNNYEYKAVNEIANAYNAIGDFDKCKIATARLLQITKEC